MVSHIKKCYTNYDIIVHRAVRLPHGTQTAVRTALPKRRRLFYGKNAIVGQSGGPTSVINSTWPAL